MATHTGSRPIRVVLGAVVAAMIFSLLVLPVMEGPVAAKGRHHHAQRQHSARDSHHDRVQSEARKPGKRKKRKKHKGNGAPHGTTSNGAQGLAGGLDPSLLRKTYTFNLNRDDCNWYQQDNPAVSRQRCGAWAFAFPYNGDDAFTGQIELFSRPVNCSTLKFEIEWVTSAVDRHTWTSAPVSPGGSTGVHDLGDDVTFVTVAPIGVYGGCNLGTQTYHNVDVRFTIAGTELPVIMD